MTVSLAKKIRRQIVGNAPTLQTSPQILTEKALRHVIRYQTL
jgi:hypothetical protein